MTETLMSARTDADLFELEWSNLDGARDHWVIAIRLLEAIHASARFLGTPRGELRIARGALDRPEFETWPIACAPEARTDLLRRVETAAELPRPLEAVLACQPIVLLPDDRLEVVDFDSEELCSLGMVPLSRVPEFASTAGLQAWRVVGGPEQWQRESLLSLELSFGAPPFANALGLGFRSRCDVWRRTRLDGESTDPQLQINAALLHDCARAIAAASGAVLRSVDS